MKILKQRLGAVFLIAAAVLTGVICPAASAENPGVYQIRQLRIENGHREVIKWNTKTGESWYNWTTVSPEWSKIPESGPVAPGDYEVMMLNGIQKDDVWAIRFEKNSGKTWNYGAKGWEEFKEAPKDGAPSQQ